MFSIHSNYTEKTLERSDVRMTEDMRPCLGFVSVQVGTPLNQTVPYSIDSFHVLSESVIVYSHDHTVHNASIHLNLKEYHVISSNPMIEFRIQEGRLREPYEIMVWPFNISIQNNLSVIICIWLVAEWDSILNFFKRPQYSNLRRRNYYILQCSYLDLRFFLLWS